MGDTFMPITISADELVRIIVDRLGEKTERGAENSTCKRGFCFILGSGASVTSNIPTGNTLGYLWMKEMDKRNLFKTFSEDRIKTMLENGELKHSLDEIINVYKDNILNESLPSEYYFDAFTLRYSEDKHAGYAYLEKKMAQATPGFAYAILAKFITNYPQCNLVITTNFDSLMEDALFYFTTQKPLVVNHESMAEFAQNPFINRPIIAKVHRGLFFRPFNDYQTNRLKTQWKSVLKSLMHMYTPIVIGYGGGDNGFMRLLGDNNVEFENGIYWCSYKDNEINNKKICRLLKKKQGRFVKTEGFDSIMLKLGNALFQEKILPNDVWNYLKDRYELLMRQYSSDYRCVSNQQNDDAASLKAAEEADTKKRETENKLTKWDYLIQGQ